MPIHSSASTLLVIPPFQNLSSHSMEESIHVATLAEPAPPGDPEWKQWAVINLPCLQGFL